MENKTIKISWFFCGFVVTEFIKTCDEFVLELLFASFLFLHLRQNEFLFLDPIYSMHLEKKLIQCSRPQISEFHLFAITISLKMAFKSCHYNMIKKGNKINFHADQIFFPKLWNIKFVSYSITISQNAWFQTPIQIFNFLGSTFLSLVPY